MRAALCRRQHVAEILDRARPQQQFPVRTARRRSECGGQAEDFRALRLQHAEQLRKTHVVAHGHAERGRAASS